MSIHIYNNTKYIVIIYHRVLPYQIEDPTDNYILQEDFEKQISYLNKNYEIVDINNIQLLNNNKKPKIIITFDDGYYDNYLYAFPILKSEFPILKFGSLIIFIVIVFKKV